MSKHVCVLGSSSTMDSTTLSPSAPASATDSVQIINRPRSATPKHRAPIPAERIVARLAVVAAVLFGLFERWRLLTNVGMTPDADEDMAGLIAKHINKGEYPTFLWNQPFGGAFDTYVVAGLQRIFGVTLFAERAFVVALGPVIALLLWRVATRFMSARSAAVAGIAMWIWPLESIAWSMQEYLYYTTLTAVGLAGVLCVQRFVENPRSLRMLFLAGLFFGVGWWTSPLVSYFVLLGALQVVPVWKPLLKRSAAVIAGFAIGALPWINFNIRHRLLSLTADLNETGSFTDHLQTFFRDGLPVALGIRSWAGGTLIVQPPNTMWALSNAIAVVLALTAVVALVRWRLRHTPFPADMVCMLLWPLISSMSPIAPSSDWWIPRYFFLFWPFLAFAVGRLGATKVGAALVGAAMVTVSMFGLSYRVHQPPVWPDVKPLTATLTDAGVTRFYASYWITQRLIYLTNERVIGAPMEVSSTRYPEYLSQVQQAENPPYVYRRNDPPELAFQRELTRLGVTARMVSTGGYDVYFPERKVTPAELSSEAY